jgi:NADP-dependent 3-hydroxy acid dehydrogenase YdfG
MSTWLITGCSTGLGRAFALEALARGHDVVVTARDASAVQDIADAHPDHAVATALDVTDADQVTAAVGLATERFGGVDVLVNNAGYGYRSAVEEGDDADVARLFDTHFHGSVRTIKAVLPGMRSRRSGTIVNLSSIGARRTGPGSGYYGAVKAALEQMTMALRRDGRQAPHRGRHLGRHPARRPRRRRAPARRRGRVGRGTLPAAARLGRGRHRHGRAGRPPRRHRCVGRPQPRDRLRRLRIVSRAARAARGRRDHPQEARCRSGLHRASVARLKSPLASGP